MILANLPIPSVASINLTISFVVNDLSQFNGNNSEERQIANSTQRWADRKNFNTAAQVLIN